MMHQVLAELGLLPPRDKVDKDATLDYLLRQFAETDDEPIEIRFVITKQDVEDYCAGKRPDIKRWIVRERVEEE